MTNDELFLRQELRSWEFRFETGNLMDILVLAKNKQDFARKYGWEELQRVVNEVYLEVFHERQKVSQVRKGSVDIPNSVRKLRKVVARQNRRKWSRRCPQLARH
jgi:ribosomal protein L29